MFRMNSYIVLFISFVSFMLNKLTLKWDKFEKKNVEDIDV